VWWCIAFVLTANYDTEHRFGVHIKHNAAFCDLNFFVDVGFKRVPYLLQKQLWIDQRTRQCESSVSTRDKF
jgi:hypothetical protein